MRTLLLTIAVLVMPVSLAAGCGNIDKAASGPSELVPAGAVIYGEANLRPEGDQKQAIDSILSKFPGGGQAGDKLKDLIEKGLRESDAPISFKEDIEPWLGDEAALFATGLGPNGQLEGSAGLIATTDEGKARDALEKSAEGKTQKHSYNDVDYLTDDSGQAGAVFDGFLVLGTEAGVKAAIDASKDGPTLSDDDAYNKATENAASDRLALFYVNSPEFLTAARQSGAPLPDSFKKFFQQPVVATVDADDDGVLVEANVPPELARSFAFFGEGSDLLVDLPADSWVALGQKDLGKLIEFYVDAYAGVAGGRDAIEGQFRAATGLDLQQDVLSWMGDFGIFVSGTSPASLDGALVVQTSDEAASVRFLAALARIAKTQADNPGDRVVPLTAPGGGKGFTLVSPDIPKPIHSFVQDGKLVFAYGDAAAKDAVNPAHKLGDSPDFNSVKDSLGDYDVSMYVLVKPILDLVESTSAGSDANWQKAKPYLEPLNALVAGTSGSGDDVKSAFKLVVK
ncbi:MAG: DUF3352 domain-containing protein [Thermoleophilaceae bacterium]